MDINLKTVSKIAFWSLGIMFLEYLALTLWSPLGAIHRYSTNSHVQGVSDLAPKQRVRTETVNGEKMFHQTDELAYFNIPMKNAADVASVSITYRNPYPDQDMYLGFQDQTDWHYATKLIDAPLLNMLGWHYIGTNPTLFERRNDYNSVQAFLKSVDDQAIIGLYNYDAGNLSHTKYKLDGYKPVTADTVIDTPLRGKHTLYAYLENEPFRMDISKQDLNWYEGEDILAIDVYKEDDLVYRAIINDDGITDASKKVLPQQDVIIQNPGPGLPEPGIYRIVLDGTGDTVITRIVTNLNKIIIDGPMYPISNTRVYPLLVASTSATTVYTNSLLVTAMTPHAEATQSLRINDVKLPIPGANQPVATTTGSVATSQVIAPLSDMILNGIPGFYSFAQNQIFQPFFHNTFHVTDVQDTDLVDYILTNYTPSVQNGDWKTSVVSFDLSRAVPKNNMLSWIIRAPKLRENNRQITIKQIDVTLTKKPSIPKNIKI